MNVLGIETSCDETSASVVQDGHKILSLSTASSAEIHAEYGGVFPELACRRHIEAIIPVIQKAISEAGLAPNDIDLIAVTKGPGLVGALLIGMQAAKGLAISLKKPLIGVNHVEAHLYAAMMGQEIKLPALGIVLSGGHTFITHIRDLDNYEPISTTVDDALGEAFDKVGILLGLPYPGGPKIEELAKIGDPFRFPFKAGFVKRNPLYFSLSGIKTSVLYAVKEKTLSEKDKADVAASFQQVVIQDVLHKTAVALEKYPAKALYLGGGVCNNQALRAAFKTKFPHLSIFWPAPNLSLDNAAMIAGLGFQKFQRHPVSNPLDLDVMARTEFGNPKLAEKT
jgi:N6-L-threonylcarbamoyladenine synthase